MLAPFLLQENSRATSWFSQWVGNNPSHKIPHNTAPQYHYRLTRVLSEVATRFQNKESLRPVVAAQRNADREMRGWGRLPPTSQWLIPTASAADGLIISSAPPLSIYLFLDACNATTLQADCTLTYLGNNIFLPTAFFQDLLQGHILAIPDPDAPTSMSPMITPPSSAGPTNAQQREMLV